MYRQNMLAPEKNGLAPELFLIFSTPAFLSNGDQISQKFGWVYIKRPN
jgi:hypothetical protein